ncbi:MAG: FAD-binding protein [Clostridiales bacterium]|nr:FAD-binding protein [Clostridiales bacterium]
MKILVFVKVIKGEINPFDESALECALGLCDDVMAVSMGPESCIEILRPITRLGAKAVLISDKAFAGSDTLVTSYILAKAVRNMEYDYIFCGRQSVDGDTGQVGPMTAKRLGLPMLGGVMSAELKDGGIFAKTRFGEETIKSPAMLCIERGYVLRFPSIFSKIGDVRVIDNSVIGCDLEKCGLKGSPTRVLESFENERGRRSCRFIKMEELVPLVKDLMSRERAVIKSENKAQKFKTVWAVGDEVYKKALEIAEEVVLIEKSSAEEISRQAALKKPNVILWNADEWGRQNAAQTAVLLETGLCADCTGLEADGDDLIMYRPAQGGNIMAKIKCITRPQMATVRTKSKSSDIIVSGGKGVFDRLDKLYALAKALNAQTGASRGLVDLGGAPYDMQIGLTGKTVSPKIYIAAGISGAVHHTCAIEGSETVIAINPDKNARIFDYADYGIIDKL